MVFLLVDVDGEETVLVLTDWPAEFFTVALLLLTLTVLIEALSPTTTLAAALTASVVTLPLTLTLFGALTVILVAVPFIVTEIALSRLLSMVSEFMEPLIEREVCLDRLTALPLPFASTKQTTKSLSASVLREKSADFRLKLPTAAPFCTNWTFPLATCML